MYSIQTLAILNATRELALRERRDLRAYRALDLLQRAVEAAGPEVLDDPDDPFLAEARELLRQN